MTLAAGILSDLDQIMADWGDTGAYNGAAAVKGLFDNEYLVLEGVDVSTFKPTFLYKTSDIASPAKGGILIVTSVLCGISAVSYTVQERQKNPPDAGPGVTRLILKKT